MNSEIRTCPGECGGDELGPGQQLCPADQKDLDRLEFLIAMKEDGVEVLTPYPHLTDGDFDELEERLKEALRATEHLQHETIEQMKKNAA